MAKMFRDRKIFRWLIPGWSKISSCRDCLHGVEGGAGRRSTARELAQEEARLPEMAQPAGVCVPDMSTVRSPDVDPPGRRRKGWARAGAENDTPVRIVSVSLCHDGGMDGAAAHRRAS